MIVEAEVQACPNYDGVPGTQAFRRRNLSNASKMLIILATGPQDNFCRINYFGECVEAVGFSLAFGRSFAGEAPAFPGGPGLRSASLKSADAEYNKK